jgi:hypothetical protein
MNSGSLRHIQNRLASFGKNFDVVWGKGYFNGHFLHRKLWLALKTDRYRRLTNRHMANACSDEAVSDLYLTSPTSTRPATKGNPNTRSIGHGHHRFPSISYHFNVIGSKGYFNRHKISGVEW